MESSSMYIISVYSENQVGLLSSISNIFTSLGINIESLTVFPSEFPGIHHITFRAITTERAAQQVVGFIEKKVEVVRAFYFPDNATSSAEHGIMEDYLQIRNQ